MYKNCVKRIIDVVLSTFGIIILSPIWLVLAIAIKVDDPGPVFFRQKRIAKDENGKKQFFQIFKYRSMKMCTPHVNVGAICKAGSVVEAFRILEAGEVVKGY